LSEADISARLAKYITDRQLTFTQAGEELKLDPVVIATVYSNLPLPDLDTDYYKMVEEALYQHRMIKE